MREKCEMARREPVRERRRENEKRYIKSQCYGCTCAYKRERKVERSQTGVAYRESVKI